MVDNQEEDKLAIELDIDNYQVQTANIDQSLKDNAWLKGKVQKFLSQAYSIMRLVTKRPLVNSK